MIRGSAIIECGNGTNESISAVHRELGTGAVFMRTCPPHKIGKRPIKEGNWYGEDAEVIMYFNNIESLDVIISTLNDLRESMVTHKEKNNA